MPDDYLILESICEIGKSLLADPLIFPYSFLLSLFGFNKFVIFFPYAIRVMLVSDWCFPILVVYLVSHTSETKVGTPMLHARPPQLYSGAIRETKRVNLTLLFLDAACQVVSRDRAWS